MELLFEYSTRLSFGLGANYFSVKYLEKTNTLHWYSGTPQHFSRFAITKAPQDIVDEIKGLENRSSENAAYLEHSVYPNIL